jgi:hypothetical protein
LPALLVVFLHFSRQLAALESVRNRYFRRWDFTNSAAIFASIVLLSSLAVALSFVLDRPKLKGLRKLYAHLFVLGLGSGVLANAQTIRITHPSADSLAWLCLVGIVSFSLGHHKTRLVPAAACFCLILSPLMPLIFFRTVAWESWNAPSQPLTPHKKAIQNASPVFLLLFDEWSYARSTANGEFLPFFANLRGFCEHSITFRQAYSPADTTYKSVPMFLYQTLEYESLPGAFVCNAKHEERVNSSRPPAEKALPSKSSSLFSLAHDYDYNTLLLGFYLPYRNMFGEELDCCRAYALYPAGDNFLSKMWLSSIENLRYWTDPVSSRCFRPLYASIYAEYWRSLNHSLHDDFLKSINAFPENTLTLLHYPLPHAPFIFNEDGSFRGTFEVDPSKAQNDDEDRMKGTPEEYEKHLRYLDVLLGELFGKLREAGKFDDALIILTSDHSWREDPDPLLRTDWKVRRHVPLIVKLPRETDLHVVDGEFSTVKLREIIHGVLARSADEKMIVSWAQRQ